MMGFWMVGTELGGDYAFAFAEHQVGVCVSDLGTWQIYDFQLKHWRLYTDDMPCLDRDYEETTIAMTTAAPTKAVPTGCNANNIYIEGANDSTCEGTVEIGGICSPKCPTGFIPICKNPEAECSNDLKWVHKGENTPYQCECKVCNFQFY